MIYRIVQLFSILFCLNVILGCSCDKYLIGNKVYDVPVNENNINLIFAGIRWDSKENRTEYSRFTMWCPLFDYDSFNEGISFKIFGTYLPNLFGYLNFKNEKGIVTPLYSLHKGELNSICFGPLFFPLYKHDYSGFYSHKTYLGFFTKDVQKKAIFTRKYTSNKYFSTTTFYASESWAN